MSFDCRLLTLILSAVLYVRHLDAEEVASFVEDTGIAQVCVRAQKNQQLCVENPEVREQCPCSCDRTCRLNRRRVADQRVKECCQIQGVPQKCMDVCSYDFSPYQLKERSLQCYTHYFKIIKCCAGGETNKRSEICCRVSGVNQSCLDFCAGNLVRPCSMKKEHFTCSTDENVWDILTCMQDNIPHDIKYYEKQKWPETLSRQDLKCLADLGLVPKAAATLGNLFGR